VIVRVWGEAEATQGHFETGLTITTNSTTLGYYQAAVGDGLVTTRMVNYQNDTCIISQDVNMKAFLGVPNLKEYSYFGDVTGNPAQVVVAHWWIQNVGAVSAVNCLFTVTIDYDITFYDPIPFT